MSVDVDVVEGGTATPQKRHEPFDTWSTTNAGDRPPTPPSPTPSEFSRLLDEIADEPLDLHSPDSPESVASNPGSPTESNPARGSPLPHQGPSGDQFQTSGTPVNHDTLSSTSHQPTLPQSPTGGSSLPQLPHPGPPEGRFPSPPGSPVNPNILSSTGHQPTPPQSPTGGSPLPHPQAPGNSDTFLDDLLKGKIKRRNFGSGPVNLAQRDPRSTSI
jgi:hypothetical protein